MDFSRHSQKDCFQDAANIGKFHFTNLKLKDKHFST